MSPKCCPAPPPLDPEADPDEEIARYAKALGHPARVKILRFLLEREECMAGAIVDELPLAQSTVSQHLKVLREAGLIHGEVDGTADLLLRRSSPRRAAPHPPRRPHPVRGSRTMSEILVFDPALCCSSGVCSPDVDESWCASRRTSSG